MPRENVAVARRVIDAIEQRAVAEARGDSQPFLCGAGHHLEGRSRPDRWWTYEALTYSV